MNKDQWENIESIIDQLLELPLSERKKEINRLCKNDADLVKQVSQMLKAIESSGSFLDEISESKNQLFANAAQELITGEAENFIGKTIDKYQITKEIGTGGMGSVYLASRCDGVFDKDVAIKLLRREYAVPAMKLQFKLERQILANLKHSGIARLYDGGIFKGLPYIVMEYVEGEPIDEYCNKNRLTVDQRITLFKSVLEIVEYAHNNLVVHRDLKPDNILITSEGNVKILDFGIAQLENESSDLVNEPSSNHFLTPKYASPEQISGSHVITSSDIYSLGTLLHQLLIDQLPYSLEEKKISEIKQIKQSCLPTEASKTLKNLAYKRQKVIASKRKTDAEQLVKKLKGDLDHIIQKSIQPNREDRYTTIGQFLDDLKSYENNLPVSARSDSLIYRSSKFVSRNSFYLSIAASILLIATLMAFVSFNRINTEHQKAVAEANKAEEVSDFLISIFEAADPNVSQKSDFNVKDLLYYGLDRSENISNPEIKASIFTVMGDALTKMSDFDTADLILNQAIEENENAFGEHSLSTADAYFAMGVRHSKESMWNLALPNFQKSYKIYTDLLDSHSLKVIQSMSKLGLSMLNEGQTDTARVLIESAYQRMQNTREPNSPELLNTMVDYAYFLGSTDKSQQSNDILERVIESYLEIGPYDDHRLIQPYHYLGINYRHLEKYEKAVENYEMALSISKDKLGEDHLTTRQIRMNLLNPLTKLGEHERVTEHYEKNIELMEYRYSESHWRIGQAYSSYAGYLMSMQEHEKAVPLFEKNLEIYQNTIGPDHIWTAYVEGALAAANRFLNNHSEAERLFKKHYEIYRNRYPDYNHQHTAQIERLIKMYEVAEGDHNDVIEQYSALLE